MGLWWLGGAVVVGIVIEQDGVPVSRITTRQRRDAEDGHLRTMVVAALLSG